MLTTEIGTLPLPNQTINLSTSSNLSATSQISTGSNGSVSLNVAGNEIGYGSVLLSVSFDYYSTSIKASGSGLREQNTYDHVKKQREFSTCFTVIDVPKVVTGSVSNIQCTTATVSGEVIDSCYDKITQRGVELNGSMYPSNIGNGLGPFLVNISDLECNKTYSVLAYATNEAGRGYGNPVTFTTLKADECVTVTTAVIDTTITCTGGMVKTTFSFNAKITRSENGIYWGYSPNPELTGNKIKYGYVTSAFKLRIRGMLPYTTIYVKGYAITNCGIVYGNQVSFTGQAPGTVTDIDGNVYKTVKIGTQEWMAENLRTTTYRDGTSLTLIDTWEVAAFDHIPGYSWYNNDISYKNPYGALYNAEAYSANYRTTDNICPSGWHLPSEADWKILIALLAYPAIGYSGNDVGGQLKEAGTKHWKSPNAGATNESCFCGLAGGYMWDIPDVPAKWIGEWGEHGSYTGYNFILHNEYADHLTGGTMGFHSLRCVKNK
jgi:uncharacterized protein (TIGR02145 family)